MGTRTVGSRKSQESSSSYKPRLSEAEKAKRARKAVATHYRNHPELREKNKLAKRASRAAKKLAKRKWDPPKKQKVVTEEIMSSDEEILTSDEEHEDLEEYPKFDSPIRGPRTPSPTVSELCGVPFDADPPNNSEPQGEDEEVASQVLTSMYLARQHQMQSLSVGSHSGTRALGVHRLTGTLTTPKCDGRAGREPSEGDSLPPSSPPPISPADPRQARQVIAPEKSGGWVSPGEWDEPGSPLPSSAYERMPWPRLFKSLFGTKGDAEPDADEQNWLDGAVDNS
ncbi:hypothetical protein DFH09DRAFT_1112381 [Mycena vulgaris]|nr:hypothetical protein DFH09DRAFT_1112381 [Mycena vulgaris]